jgi:hypothetical protein
MSNFNTIISNTSEGSSYKLIFNTTDKEHFEAMQALARRLIDRDSVYTNYEYLCTRTPKEMSHILAAMLEACDEKAMEKLIAAGIDVTLVSLDHDIAALSQLHWLNEPHELFQEEEYESDIDPDIE